MTNKNILYLLFKHNVLATYISCPRLINSNDYKPVLRNKHDKETNIDIKLLKNN